jgi:PTS system mannose-specific IIC component
MLESVLAKAVLLSLVGGVLSLDKTAAFQTGVSRPIVVGPLTGYLLGDAGAGLMVGVLLELLLIGNLPVGAYVPVHETGLAILVTAVTITAFGPGMGAEAGQAGFFGAARLMPAAFLVSIPVSRIYQKADAFTRGFNKRFFDSALAVLESGRPVNLVRENMKGLVPFFLTSAVALFITITPLMAAASFVPAYAPGAAGRFLYPAFAGCAVLGIAAALNAVYTLKSVYLFSASGIAVSIIWVFVR